MQFDWNLLKPSQEISEAHASLAREIADTALKTGVGIPDHQKRVELRKDRHLLDELFQFGLIRNVANRFYPTFPGLYLVDSPLRDTYATALDLMFRAIKAIFELRAYQLFRIQEIEQQFTKLLSGIDSEELRRTIAADSPPHKAALFLQDFPHFVYIQEAQYPNSPALTLNCTSAMFDYEDLTEAWKHELAQRPKAAAPQPEQPKALTEPRNSTEKRNKVFVIHGRDQRLRDGVFAFLRALGLDPLEWNKALKLVEKGAPYVGEVLEAAFNQHAQAVVVILSPDDEARLRKKLGEPGDPPHERELTGQARPNVLFEAGMAFGSKPDQTVIIQFGHVRPFSDILGRHIVKMDGSPERRHEFAIKLEASGCSVDMDGTDWLRAGDLTPSDQNKKSKRPRRKVKGLKPPKVPDLLEQPKPEPPIPSDALHEKLVKYIMGNGRKLLAFQTANGGYFVEYHRPGEPAKSIETPDAMAANKRWREWFLDWKGQPTGFGGSFGNGLIGDLPF